MPDDVLKSKIVSVELRVTGGIQVAIVNLGATIASIKLPVDGDMIDVILSYPEIKYYEADRYYLGATVGRVANRIANARFPLGAREFELDANESAGPHCLHGGTEGFSRQYFEMDPGVGKQSVRCRHLSAAGSGGFPANLEVEVTYTCLTYRSLAIDFFATADDDTVVNLANHAYFNLGGEIDGHELRVVADQYTPVDDTLIPTGEIRSVAGSEFDLRQLTRLGNARFDQNFVLPITTEALQLAAELHSPATGITLRVRTTQPALQVYTGDYLDLPWSRRQGLCLEAQGFPDALNQPAFPSIRLQAGEVYRQRTVYEFEVADPIP